MYPLVMLAVNCDAKRFDPIGLTPRTKGTTSRHPKNALLPGLDWGLLLKPRVKGGKKVRLFMGMAPRLKTVPNVPMRFPDYGITNVSNFR